jgi:serine protease
VNPNDPYFSEQKGLTQLNAPAGWACIPPDAPEVIVAVVDSGIADNHADFHARVLPPQKVINILRDDDDHGTMVAGTIGAITGNSLGIAGAAPVKILSVKFCSEQCWPDPCVGAEAIHIAANFTEGGKNPGVIVLAWDVGYNHNELQVAMEEARSKDAVVVAAAGNHAHNNDRYANWPANYSGMTNVITVMATHQIKVLNSNASGGAALQVIDDRASFSNYGENTVHLGAPAIDILTTTPYFGAATQGSIRIGYRAFTGTSASAAFVGGLAALIRAKNPGWNATQVKTHLLASVRHAPALKRFCTSKGVADYQRALCP